MSSVPPASHLALQHKQKTEFLWSHVGFRKSEDKGEGGEAEGCLFMDAVENTATSVKENC